MQVSISKKANSSRPKTVNQIKIIKTNDHRTLMCLTPYENNLFPSINPKDITKGNLSKNLNQIKIIKNNNLQKNFEEVKKKVSIDCEKINPETNKQIIINNNNLQNDIKIQRSDLISATNKNVIKSMSYSNIKTPTIGIKHSYKASTVRQSPENKDINFKSLEKDTINKLLKKVEFLEKRIQLKDLKIATLEKAVNSKSECSRLDKLNSLLNVLEEKIHSEICNYRNYFENLNNQSSTNNNNLFANNNQEMSFRFNEKMDIGLTNNKFISNNSLIMLSPHCLSASRKLNKDFNNFISSENVNSANNFNLINKYNNLNVENLNKEVINEQQELKNEEYKINKHKNNENTNDEYSNDENDQEKEININCIMSKNKENSSNNIISPMGESKYVNLINNCNILDNKGNYLKSTRLDVNCNSKSISIFEQNSPKKLIPFSAEFDEVANKSIFGKSLLEVDVDRIRENLKNQTKNKKNKIKFSDSKNFNKNNMNPSKSLDVRKVKIKNELRNSMVNLSESTKAFRALSAKRETEQYYSNNNTLINNLFSQNLIFLLENIIELLHKIRDSILDSKKFSSFIKEKEKKYNKMKNELDQYKHREKQSKKIYENLKSKISDLEFEKVKLLKYSKSDQILKMMEANSDNYFAKQNIDLKRRLEIACILLVKKKEKIARLHQKVDSLSNQIKEIVKSKNYFENEEKKMVEVLHKKLVYEKISKGEEKITDFILADTSNKETEEKENLKIPKLNYEMSENLQFRINKLKEDYKEIIRDIIGNDSQEFLKIFQNFDEIEKENTIIFIVEQLKSYMNFSQKLNSLIFFFINSLNYNKDELMVQIRLKFTEIFEAERVTLWSFDDYVNQYNTMVDMNKIIVEANDEYFDKISKNGIYKKSKINKDENKGPEIEFNKNQKQFSVKNLNQTIKELNSTKNVIPYYNPEKKRSNLNICENVPNNESNDKYNFNSNSNTINTPSAKESIDKEKKYENIDENNLNNYFNEDNAAQKKEKETYQVYPHTLEKFFPMNKPVDSILAVPIKNNVYYGLIEIINSKNGYFSLDDEYLVYIISKYLKSFLYNYNMEEAKQKERNKDMIPGAIIEIMSKRDLFSLTQIFEYKLNSLINSHGTKLIFVNSEKNELTYFKNSSNNQIIKKALGGIAGLSVKLSTGILCKYPNHDENYNELIDIELKSNNNCFYSIPIKKENFGIFAVFQFIMIREENIENQQKKMSTHQIEILDYFREMAIEIMGNCLEKTITCIDIQYFNKEER